VGRFYTTSDFDREYLRNETRYPKSERHVTENDSSCVQPNKSGELWSTTCEFGRNPTRLFRQTISATREYWPLKFLHAIDTDQGLLEHTANRVGGPRKILRANI